ncbi:MAG: shikimate kinase [Hyphomicrobiales bacterium]
MASTQAYEAKSAARRPVADKPGRVCGLLGSRSVVLIGLMGAGKTTVGRRLAAAMGLDFFDADQEIEKAAGMSVAEIFDNHGEEYFRDGERRVLARLLEPKPRIVSTGGGAFMHADTRDLVRQRSVSVWLRGELPLLLERVMRRNNRPLLKKNPEAVLKKLIAERHPVYQLADITVDSRAVAHEVIVDDIISALDVFLTQTHANPDQDPSGQAADE